MLQTTFILPIRQAGVLPTVNQVYNPICCTLLFPCPLARGESYPPKLHCMIVDVNNDFSPDHWQWKVVPTQTKVHDSRCCKRPFSSPSVTEDSNPPKLQCMTLDVAKDFSPAHWQGGSLTHPNSSASHEMLQTTFLLPIRKGRVCRCCKMVFFCLLAREESYLLKL